MSSILPYALGFALFLTVGVLFTGIISFAMGGKVNAKYATKLMATRVILQGIAVALFGLIVLLQAA